MDDKTRDEIAELILRILLEEILHDGKIDPEEKDVFQTLFKALRVSKPQAEKIHRDVAAQIEKSEKKGPLNLVIFFRRLRIEIPKYGLSDKASEALITRLARTLKFNLSAINTSKDETSKENDYELQGAQVGVLKNDSEPLEMQSDLENRAENSEIWKSDWIHDFPNQFGGGVKKTINLILESRASGAHLTALKMLQDYSLPIDYHYRYLLQARILYELDRISEAGESLQRAKTAGLECHLFNYEFFFMQSAKMQPENMLQGWLELHGFVNPLPEIKQEGLRELGLNLEGRFSRLLALNQLEVMADDNQSFFLLDQFRDQTFEDIYFRYYGRGIMLIQLIASMFVVVICLYNFGYVGPALRGIFLEVASGVPNFDIFIGHLGIVLSYSFLFVALLPVAYINGAMLFASYQGKVLSYTENYPGFIKICNFGRVFHLRKRVRDKPLFIYQDDNDYTYISLVRHLPFVPNFTYIYGFDELRGFHALLPLFGVADGYLFKKKHLSGLEDQVFPINMAGVRIAQSATIISFLRTSIYFSIPILMICIGLESLYMVYATEASLKSYIITFLVLIISVFMLYFAPGIVLKLLRSRFLSLPFTINIIKPGLLFLTGFYLLLHYSVYSYSGVIPAACGLAGFYLLFIRTKYSSEKKQIVAYVSSLDKLSSTKDCVIKLSYGLSALLLGKEKTKFGNSISLFFNRDFIVLPGRFMGMTLYYEVINLTSGLKIKLCEITNGTRLRISNFNYDLDCSLEELRNKFESVKIPIEMAPIKEGGHSKIPFDQLGIITGVWLLWQILIVFVDPGYEPKKFQPSMNFMEQVVSLIDIKGDALFHKEEMVEYRAEIKKNEKRISIEHKELITWEEFEDAVRSKYASADKLYNQTSSIQAPDFILPSFIKKDGFRDDILEFLSWGLWTHWHKVDSLRYGKELEVYCANFGAATIKRSKNLVCSFSFNYDHAIQWIQTHQKIPDIFDLPILRELVVVDGNILKFMNKAAAMDPDLVTKAVAKDGMLLEHADPRLRIDKNIVLAAIRSNYKAYQFMNPALFSDISVMSALVEKDGLLLEQAAPALKSNHSIVFKAIKQNYLAHRFMNKSFWKKPDICTELLSKNGLLLEYLDGPLKNMDRLVKVAIMQNGEALKFASDIYRRDHGIVSMALNNNASAWKHMDSSLLKHRDLAIRVLKEDGLQLAKLDEKFRADPDMVVVAIEQNYRAFQSMSDELWKNPMVVKSLLGKHGLALEFVDPDLKSDRDLIELALKQSGLALEFLPKTFENDRELILTAVRSNGESLQFAPKNFRTDPLIVLEAAKDHLDSVKYALISRERLKKEAVDDNPVAQIIMSYFNLEAIRASKYSTDESQQILETMRNLLIKASEKGFPIARRMLAESYLIHSKLGQREMAWKWMEGAAEQGDLEAITRIGEFYEMGFVVYKDENKALNWYLKAAEKGYLKAQFKVGKLLDSLPNLQTNSLYFLDWYLKAAESGYMPAQTVLGELFYFGRKVERDLVKAHSWFVQSGRKGDLLSQVYLGIINGWGLGVPSSWEQAKKWFELARSQNLEFPECFGSIKVTQGLSPKEGESIKDWILARANQGLPEFLCAAGVLYERGELGTDKDPKKSVEYYSKAALTGYASAQNRLGQSYLLGHGIDQDSELAFNWFSKGALSGYLPAQTNLGKSYEQGIGVTQNLKEAFGWYSKAADGGFAPAQVALGRLYEDGKGLNRDYKKSVFWYEKAAVQGNAEGQTSLAIMYEFGKGVSKDQAQAVDWYLKASSQNDSRAIRNLNFMRERGLEIPEEF